MRKKVEWMFIVGIGEYVITNNREECIVTHALGSCVALIIHSPKTKYTAMAHIVLPKVPEHRRPEDSKLRPAYFAENIIPGLVNFFNRETREQTVDLQVYLVGGAEAQNPQDVFQVGSRNVAYIRNKLRQYNIKPEKEVVGGQVSRTVTVSVDSGLVSIKQQKMIL